MYNIIKKTVYKHMKMCYNIDYIMHKVDNSENTMQ